MQPDAALACVSGDPAHLGKLEGLARHPAHRRLDRDRADRDPHAGLGGAGDFGCRLGQGEARPAGAERHQRDPAQLLRAVALVVVEMALALDQHTAPIAREEPQGEVVGERAARHEHGRLFAEERGHPLLEFGDDAAP
jgi:hypothetical protein